MFTYTQAIAAGQCVRLSPNINLSNPNAVPTPNLTYTVSAPGYGSATYNLYHNIDVE